MLLLRRKKLMYIQKKGRKYLRPNQYLCLNNTTSQIVFPQNDHCP